jgi:hypothetical protein
VRIGLGPCRRLAELGLEIAACSLDLVQLPLCYKDSLVELDRRSLVIRFNFNCPDVTDQSHNDGS